MTIKAAIQNPSSLLGQDPSLVKRDARGAVDVEPHPLQRACIREPARAAYGRKRVDRFTNEFSGDESGISGGRSGRSW